MQKQDINKAMEMVSERHSISPFTAELAGSVNTVHVAMGHVPSKQDYNYGTTFSQDLAF